MPARSKYLTDILSIALYSVCGGIAMTAFSCGACLQSASLYTYVAVFTAVIWFVMWVGNGLLAEYIGTKISWVQQPVKRLIVGVLSTLAYSTGTVSLLLFIFEYVTSVRFGNYLIVIEYTVVLTSLISLFMHSREFLKSWRQSAIDAERFEKESIRAQYDSLRNQLNPHFLFNSLNALTNLVYEDADKAAKFIKQLSDVYRYLLDTRDMDVVGMDEELKFLRSYIYLQEIRFSKNLSVEIMIPDIKSSLPPLALQLLVENAVKHNIVSRDQPLSVRVYSENNFIVVENNLQKKSEPDENLSGLGLENIKKRYAFLTDRPISVEETNERFIVRLPILTLSPL